MREDFDEVWIIDLEGESKGPLKTENVFDIQVGVCILVAVRRDSARPSVGEAVVHYTRVKGSRREKEGTLRTPLRHLPWSTAPAGPGEPFVPVTDRSWRRWIALDELMPVRQSGVQTKRDQLVVGATPDRLAAQLERYASTSDENERRRAFHETSSRSAAPPRWDASLIRRYGYRPLSRQFLYDDTAFIDRPRPRLRALWHHGQRAFVTLPKGHGGGPAVFLHTELPDLHAFRGSMGGHVFPLWLDAAHSEPNLARAVVPRLREHLGEDLTASRVFDYIYGLLSAPSYTTIFRSGLEQGFPRVPFPLARGSFDEVVELGSSLQQAHDLDRDWDLPRLQGHAGLVTEGFWDEGRLYVSGQAFIEDVSEQTWLYEVSGYRVVPRWLKQRVGLDLARDLSLVREARRVVAAVQSTVESGPALDAALMTVVQHDTLGSASLLPLDPVKMAVERHAHAAEDAAGHEEAALWEELSDEALRLAEQAP